MRGAAPVDELAMGYPDVSACSWQCRLRQQHDRIIQQKQRSDGSGIGELPLKRGRQNLPEQGDGAEVEAFCRHLWNIAAQIDTVWPFIARNDEIMY